MQYSRIAVFASGQGSNFAALIQAQNAGSLAEAALSCWYPTGRKR